ncbi:MAG: HAD-IIB family hydrolase [Gammaproteobacteria bacterium]|nr:HAD-IIB family hydrolase [Gammaproteobacteria bacterium]MCW9059059.1 HAD-IIB family hydrolase [Gammaproteobacteria bacterium]
MKHASEILLCCDLDRTVLPNGHEPEDVLARPLFARVVARPEITLVYVSGRDRRLLQQAIRDYAIPVPDFAIGDVGTTLYHIEAGEWREETAWSAHIAQDWQGEPAQTLHGYLRDLPELRLQEPEKQNRHKLSYYTTTDLDAKRLREAVRQCLAREGVTANLIWSIDEVNRLGLLDILPARASKLHAIEFFMGLQGVSAGNTVFAGDSGNDLPVLASSIPAVLVRNAQEEVREEALALARQQGTLDALYLAQGDFLGLNGHYTAGILEGLAHFQPRTQSWIETELQRLQGTGHSPAGT